jgi:hypothetical protein
MELAGPATNTGIITRPWRNRQNGLTWPHAANGPVKVEHPVTVNRWMMEAEKRVRASSSLYDR